MGELTFTEQPENDIVVKSSSDDQEDDILFERKKFSLHELVSFRESFIVITLLLINVILFGLANALVGAEEYITLGLGSLTPISFKVFDFGLESSFKLMNDAGAHGIAILILLLSSVWPYVKSITLAVMWFLPVCRTTREWTLWTIDLLGKWSFLDFFFMMILGLAFMIGGGPENELYLGLGIYCTTGVYLFILAAIMSLAITQYVVSVHHRVMYGKKGLKHKEGRVNFENKFAGKYLHLVAVLFLTFVSLWLFIWGSIEPCFTFHYRGALTEMITKTPDVTYSLVNMGKTFPEATYNKYGAGPTFFAFLYYVFIFVSTFSLIIIVPLTWIAYVFDFSFEKRGSILHIVQTIAAWTSPDVFLLSLGAGTVQLNVVIQQSIIEAANQVRLGPTPTSSILDEFCGTDPQTLFNMTCLSVETELERGYFIIVGACVVFYLMTIPTAVLLAPKLHKKKTPELQEQIEP